MTSRIFRSRSGDSTSDASHGILRPRRIAVPVRGDPVDDDALRAACRLARPSKASILVITVLEVARNLPLSVSLGGELGRAEEVLAQMEELAASLDSKVQTTVLQAREAGPAIVDEARRWDADLMIVGVGTKPRFGEFTMGRTGTDLLNHAHCRLLLIRAALPEAGLTGRAEVS